MQTCPGLDVLLQSRFHRPMASERLQSENGSPAAGCLGFGLELLLHVLQITFQNSSTAVQGCSQGF